MLRSERATDTAATSETSAGAYTATTLAAVPPTIVPVATRRVDDAFVVEDDCVATTRGEAPHQDATVRGQASEARRPARSAQKAIRSRAAASRGTIERTQRPRRPPSNQCPAACACPAIVAGAIAAGDGRSIVEESVDGEKLFAPSTRGSRHGEYRALLRALRATVPSQ